MRSPSVRSVPLLAVAALSLALLAVAHAPLAQASPAVRQADRPVRPAAAESGKRPLELTDLMKLKTLHGEVISDGGSWIAYEARPDRGDGEVRVRSVDGEASYTIERGTAPELTTDGAWAGAMVQPTLEDQVTAEKAGESGDDAPKPGFALLSTADGSTVSWERIDSFAFSADGRWLAVHRLPEKAADEAEPADGEETAAEEMAPETEPEGEETVAQGPAASTVEPTEAAGEQAPAEELAPESVEPPQAEPAEGEPQEVEGEVPRPAEVETEPAGEPAEGAEQAHQAEQVNQAHQVGAAEDGEETKGEERLGSTLVLRELATGREVEIPHVEAYAFSETGDADSFLAVTIAAPKGEGNGLFVRSLAPDAALRPLAAADHGRYTALVWAKHAPRLGFVAAVDDEDGEPGEADVEVWRAGDDAARVAAASADAPEGWFVPSVNELAWSDDGERLFFGYKPDDEKIEPEAADDTADTADSADTADTAEAADGEEAAPFDPYDVDAILADRGVDVWGWNDPLIIPEQKVEWDKEKDRTYRGVWHAGGGEGGHAVALAGRTMRNVDVTDNPHATLGFADVPYLQEITWRGWFSDVYRVDLQDGSRQLVTKELEGGASLSPGGRYVVYYRTPDWFLFDGATGETRNLTAGMEVPFADEDHDYPAPAPGYGVADWVEDDSAVLIYDKYDVWQFPTTAEGLPASPTSSASPSSSSGEPLRLTDGREQERIYRIVDLDPETPADRDSLAPDADVLMTGYSDREKHRGLFSARVGRAGVRKLVEEKGKTYSVVAKAKYADRLLFTRESYREFPDLWTGGLDLAAGSLSGRIRRSDANPQIDQFGWGTAELVHWTSSDGIPLDGVLIKPAGYEQGKRYPVLVYYYRFFTQRLHRFNEPVVNHRPSFPHYASHGYAIFLPDIRFEVGRPGLAATKCLVSGVQHLIEMGVADPKAIGLHGHSWSGYQTAFVITQTDLFAAAAAGAPVSNMTSSYGGIRYESGLARQFQYEESQSRLGASLWENRDLYIESSPLFYADRIKTPLLIEFGDKDGAVPWTQGIELYLAMRRLRKPAFFLEYRGEPHHLTKYPNKVDYSIKMMEFFDHYLKGAPAPDWMTKGVPYRGK